MFQWRVIMWLVHWILLVHGAAGFPLRVEILSPLHKSQLRLPELHGSISVSVTAQVNVRDPLSPDLEEASSGGQRHTAWSDDSEFCIKLEFDAHWACFDLSEKVVSIAHLEQGSHRLHVQIKRNGRTISDTATSEFSVVSPANQISMVLPLTLEDAGRAMLLLGSLNKCWQNKSDIATLWVIVPDHHVFAFAAALGSGGDLPIEVVSERTLFHTDLSAGWPGYALQMSLKLLAAKLVKTDFYMTLDADVICAAPLNMGNVVRNGKGGYNPEARSVHSQWWEASERLLGFEQAGDHVQFGATPSVLRTDGALSVLRRLEDALGKDWEMLWLSRWGTGVAPLWWSEYTLYRIVAEKDGTFESFHTPIPLYCNTSVWFEGDAQTWDPAYAFTGLRSNRDAHAVDSEGNLEPGPFLAGSRGQAPCPFIVLQSRLDIPVSHIAKIVAPWIEKIGEP
jgi:hypothetical protein